MYACMCGDCYGIEFTQAVV